MNGRGRSSSNARKQNNCTPFRDIKHQLLGIGLIALSALGVASFFTPTLGMLGNLFERAILVLAGNGRYFLPVLLALAGYKIMTGEGRLKITARTTGIILLYVTLLCYLHMDFIPSEHFPAALEGRGGGITGAAGAYLFKLLFGMVGTYIMLAALAAVSLILITGSTLGHLGMVAALRTRAVGSRMGSTVLNFLFEEVDPGKENDNKVKFKSETSNVIKINENEPPEVSCPTEPVEDSGVTGNLNPVIKTSTRKKPADEIVEPIEIAPLALSDGKVYRLPPVSLLSGPKSKKPGVSNTEISERTRILEETLVNFGITARVAEVAVGPAITRYEIQPPPGVKVSRIVGLADDIALSLAAPGVRIEAPIPGKAAVGIEVPNREISMVSLRELVESREFTTPSSRLTVALGKDIAGTPMVADLGKMPHLLVAGATGSGKSVCINTLVSSILYRATPDEVKFLMIDPKMVELTTYNGIPHLISPVVTDAKKAAGTLRWAVKEMERRYELFAQTGVRDISRYNKLCGVSSGESAPAPLPFIIVIIDELADLMMVAPADVEDSICRLAQMARAAGMHLLVATQRPSVDVITGLIKANIPSRISFAVSSQMDSRTILDMGGAEKLLGKGDMLFFPVGVPKPVRLQGAFLSDQEVEALVTYIKEQAEPVYDEQVLKTPPAEEKNDPASLEDELLPQAVQIFIESGTASISLLQRRLHIGYARAARLVDIMERNGIVGGFEGSKPRSILMSLEQYQQTFNSGSQ